MIGYVTVGTNDLERAAGFYDALLGELGATRTREADNFVMWSTGPDAPFFIAIKPNDGAPATVGNGCMTGLKAGSRAQVDALHKKALELGAQDEGAPGERMHGFYGGYFRDLDGHKLVFFVMGEG